jgi:3-hydroxyisobutyrate dehydrogenase
MDPLLLNQIFVVVFISLFNWIQVSSAKSFATELYNPVPGFLSTSPSSNNYEGGYSINLLIKDLTIAIETADNLGFDMETLKKCRSYFQLAQDGGDGHKDFSIVYQYMRKL